MRIQEFMRILGDVSEVYVDEYADINESAKKSRGLKRWKAIAAIIVVIFLFLVPSVSHFINKANMEDPRGGFTHYFEDYEDLCKILPSDSILAKVPTEDYEIIECKGTCLYRSDRDVSKFENYSYLNIEVYCKKTEKTITVKFVPKYYATAEYYRETRMKQCPPEHYGFMVLCNTDIYMSKAIGANGQLCCSANWAIGKDIYEIRSGIEDEGEFIDFIECLLK